MSMFDFISGDVALNVLSRTLIIFFFAFLVLRLLGRKHLTHLTYLDLLLIVALGSAVGDVMIYDESVAQLFSSIIAISVVGVIVKVLNEVTTFSKKIGSLVVGQARLVIEDGKILKKVLQQEDIGEDELMGLLRLKGFENTTNIKKAFIEADGELSVITYN